MALRRVTIQDVADACGLSRNTVSKVFNNRGTVQEPTRQAVLKAAQELGYFQFPQENQSTPEARGQSIALLTSHMPTDYHFGTLFIPAFAAQISRAGYTLMMHELSEEELRLGSLPPHISLEQTAGFIGIELFDKDYVDRLCERGLPTIIADGVQGSNISLMNCDWISMENLSSTVALVEQVIAKGARKIGFIGDPEHCNSFYERWTGFCSALQKAGIPLDAALCILERDDSPYGDPAWLADKLRQMPELPDALVCVNDFVAIHTMSALKQMGISIPDRVMVTGFDGTAQSAVVEPSLTTVQIPSAEIGRLAADTLLNRIENPDRPFCCVYVKTTPILRETTARTANR